MQIKTPLKSGAPVLAQIPSRGEGDLVRWASWDGDLPGGLRAKRPTLTGGPGNPVDVSGLRTIRP
eukprot:10593366-Alexandrium_andersonii.AAC.1